ncbi:hypothetical protein [Streptomyces flaveolus]|uniref:hypothetical protein n=1 Tax=Streptomyces flaveolus TaxID=67297 RepID=UPI0016712492|nr:hypothetical protein [Streptomyces flaveolus]GGQ81215.1 hypothetical protein GCM10010216_48830 [Streptomyces flaveolus]
MTRLQILELPEGADDSRPPFVLVVDETLPQRVVIGMDHGAVPDYWQRVAAEIGARGVIVTPETVEIPANDVADYRAESFVPDPAEALRRLATLDDESEQRARHLENKLKEFAEAHYRENLDRMDAVTDALGFDRLRDWDEIVSAIRRQRQIAADGEHVFGEPGYQDPQRCAQCGLDRNSWIMQRDTRTCSTVRADAESGHEFRPIGARDELACLRCGMPRIEWAVRRDTPQCDVVRQGGE